MKLTSLFASPSAAKCPNLISKLVQESNPDYTRDPAGITKSADNYMRKVLPFLLRTSDMRDKNSLRVFDMGCGMALLGHAVAQFNSSPNELQLEYLGLDIKADIIDWLKKAYCDYPSHSFIHHKTTDDLDYIGAVNSDASTRVESDGSEGSYQLDGKFDIQWSCSVFTHLTRNACDAAMATIAKHASHDGIQVNTWLIVDELSLYSMHIGIADRKLDYEFGDYLTYSKTNPLLCTAYKWPAIQEMYEKAGLEILDVKYGSWRGTDDNGIIYQDIIVSKRR